jgi:hypothetical protein
MDYCTRKQECGEAARQQRIGLQITSHGHHRRGQAYSAHARARFRYTTPGQSLYLLYDIRINSGAPFDRDSLTFCHNRHGPARATAMATLTLTRNDDKTTMTTMSNFVMLHCLSVHCNAFIHHIPIPRRNHTRQPHIQQSFLQ